MDAALDHEITAVDLVDIYRAGIFPMAESADNPGILWMDPQWRGVIPLDRFHIPTSLKKILKRRPFIVTVNAAFDRVVDSCASVREDTWINPTIRQWYSELHRMGYAHSMECWDRQRNLVGGLYGVSINGAFFGESMFSRARDASKIALVHLVGRLRQRGFSLLDCQFVNPHLVQFGCVEIERDDYHSALAGALSLEGVSFVDSGVAGASAAGASSGAVSASS
jgi:leucyl/phenylalanyl-tRNA--protein transferase